LKTRSEIRFFWQSTARERQPTDREWPATDRHSLACSKKTQRDSDWPFVDQLALQLCKAGNVRGLLHLRPEEALVHYRTCLKTRKS
jgi:hypothetical protein